MLALPTTVLGRTGLVVTRFGIGGAYGEGADDYRAALDLGITYLDTARGYKEGLDEEQVGEALQGRRDGIVLATKALKRDAKGAREELEASLRALRTDWIDIWQMHYVNTPEAREQILAPGGALEAATRARDEGLVRFIGITGHSWEQLGLALQTGLFDTVLCWYNAAYREPEKLVFPVAEQHGTGVIIMNAGRNDKLFAPEDAPPPEAFYRYVLGNPSVDVTIMGLRDVAVYERIARALVERDSLTPQERETLEAWGSRLRHEGKLEMSN